MSARVGIYVRISKDRMGRMIGVARQEEDCRARAAEHGWTVAQVYVENDTSAFSKKPRPAWQRLLADIRSGVIDAVLAQHPDRFNKGGRDLEDLIDAVEASGCRIDTVNYRHYDLSSRSGRMLARMIGVVARDESEAKSERYKDKHAELARKGAWHGGPRPYGYDLEREPSGRPKKNATLVMVAEEAAVVREAAERALAGETLYSICRDLNDRGVLTAQGATWRTPTMHRILTTGTHAGKREYRGTVVSEAAWPAIIDEVTHRGLRHMLVDRRPVGPRARVSLLSGGVARCGLCGARLVTQRTQSGARVYVCLKGPNGQGCGRISCRAEPLEALIVEVLMLRLDTSELAKALERRTSEPPSTAEADLAKAEAKLEELANLYAADHITPQEWIAAREPLARDPPAGGGPPARLTQRAQGSGMGAARRPPRSLARDVARSAKSRPGPHRAAHCREPQQALEHLQPRSCRRDLEALTQPGVGHAASSGRCSFHGRRSHASWRIGFGLVAAATRSESPQSWRSPDQRSRTGEGSRPLRTTPDRRRNSVPHHTRPSSQDGHILHAPRRQRSSAEIPGTMGPL